MRLLHSTLIAVALVSLCVTREIPLRVKEFQDLLREGRQCNKTLASGLRTSLDGPETWYYCGDYVNTTGSFVYAASSAASSSENQSSQLTIDCDGTRSGPEDTGLCGRLYHEPAKSTAFQHLLKASGIPVKDFNTYFHPYVALGDFRAGQSSRSDFMEFDPQDEVVEPLSLVAVVCNGKMFYGLWADTNNDTVPQPLVGQLSVAMAKMCYGEQAVETQQRLDTGDLMFLAFTGTQATPGYYGADWRAETPEEFEQGLALLGNKLIKRRVFSGMAAPRGGSVDHPDPLHFRGG
ncbi:hypothetical protein PG993_004844 [Apiospora rasikravindrae]|uniref:Endo-chitosanase n=1 Tax=Apiospora rasikravindrae TaxID=990691 RepID=A0ABR1TDX0_9PEZI